MLEKYKPHLNILNRGVASGLMLLLVVFLGREMPASDFANFGIFQAILLIGVYLAGLDFYQILTRDLPGSDPSHQAKLISLHFSSLTIVHLVFFGLNIFVIRSLGFSWELSVLTGFIVFSDHYSQEFLRIFFALKQVRNANIIILIRRSFWIMLFVGLCSIDKSHVQSLYYFWLFGNLASVLVGAGLLLKSKLFMFSALGEVLDYFKRTFGVAKVFYFSTLLIIMSTHVNRFFIKGYLNDSDLSIYTMYANLVSGLDILIQSGVVLLMFPVLVENKDNEKFAALFRKFKSNILWVTVAGSFIVFMFGFVIFRFEGFEIYNENIKLFGALVFGAAIVQISNIYHYFLWIKKADFKIMVSSIVYSVATIFFGFALIPKWGLEGAVFGFGISGVFLLAAKYYYSSQIESS